MPAGLDGNPNPIRTAERDMVLSTVADRVGACTSDRVLVGIDGGSGAGKSTFADELANELRSRGLTTIRSTTDSFHRPRHERSSRGATSAAGYYLDSHLLDRIVDELLVPFRRGDSEVLVAAFDEPSDTPVERVAEVGANAVLVFDGLFVHRPEFGSLWDISVHLDADERRDADWLTFLLDDLPETSVQRATELDRRLDAARWPRYREGWTSYVRNVDPSRRATFVIDNNDIAHPRLHEN